MSIKNKILLKAFKICLITVVMEAVLMYFFVKFLIMSDINGYIGIKIIQVLLFLNNFLLYGITETGQENLLVIIICQSLEFIVLSFGFYRFYLSKEMNRIEKDEFEINSQKKGLKEKLRAKFLILKTIFKYKLVFNFLLIIFGVCEIIFNIIFNNSLGKSFYFYGM